MRSHPSDWFTRARHIFYGTATALVEILQDPEKRMENLNLLTMDLKQLAEELEQKGELTEQEAIHYLESLRDPTASHPQASVHTPTPAGEASPAVPAESPSASPGASSGSSNSVSVSKEEMAELMELIHQIESLRLDLERLRTHSPSSPSTPHSNTNSTHQPE